MRVGVKPLKMERRCRGLYLPGIIIQESTRPTGSVKLLMLGKRNLGAVVLQR
jgi:hypothetical protein